MRFPLSRGVIHIDSVKSRSPFVEFLHFYRFSLCWGTVFPPPQRGSRFSPKYCPLEYLLKSFPGLQTLPIPPPFTQSLSFRCCSFFGGGPRLPLLQNSSKQSHFALLKNTTSPFFLISACLSRTFRHHDGHLLFSFFSDPFYPFKEPFTFPSAPPKVADSPRDPYHSAGPQCRHLFASPPPQGLKSRETTLHYDAVKTSCSYVKLALFFLFFSLSGLEHFHLSPFTRGGI